MTETITSRPLSTTAYPNKSTFGTQPKNEPKTFKTSKGTELPLLDLRGKDYLQVAHRLVWFREEHPNWVIETEIARHEGTAILFKAFIKDENGRIVSMAHKAENKQGFADYIEKAETGAIGRALAMCGYGTQFAPEFDEGERLADAPVDRVTKSNESKNL